MLAMLSILNRRVLNRQNVLLLWNTNVFKSLEKTNTFSISAIDCGIVNSSSSDVVIPKISVGELIFSKTEDYHKYIAIQCSTTGKQYTFEQLRRASINFGKALRRKLKLKKGDVVAILLPNCPEFAVTVLGTLSSGAILTSLNPLYTPGEISKQLLNSRTKLIVTRPSLYNNVKQASNLAKLNIPVITVKEKIRRQVVRFQIKKGKKCILENNPEIFLLDNPGISIGKNKTASEEVDTFFETEVVDLMASESLPLGAINFEELINEHLDIPDISNIDPNDVAFLPYSSGTTSLPKGVQLSHSNLVSNLCQLMHPDFDHSISPSESHQDVFPCLLPMFHIYAFTCGLLKQLLYGTKILSISKFNPDNFVSLLQDHPVTHLYAAPPLVLFLATSPKIHPEHFRVFRKLVSAAAPLSYSDEVRFLEKMQKPDVIVSQAYGLTETSPIVSWVHKEHKTTSKNKGTAGKILPNTCIKFVPPEETDSEDTALGPNEVGELLVKGPQNAQGYYNNPEESERLYKGDWLRTGDIGYYNEDGNLFITDRIKELIKVKGFQVAPAELEGIIRSYPSIRDAAVIGVPHPRYGEVPRAYVVVKKDQALKSNEVEEFVANKVVQYKHLVGGVQIVDAIPKNPSGKILRRELKRQYQETGL